MIGNIPVSDGVDGLSIKRCFLPSIHDDRNKQLFSVVPHDATVPQETRFSCAGSFPQPVGWPMAS